MSVKLKHACSKDSLHTALDGDMRRQHICCTECNFFFLHLIVLRTCFLYAYFYLMLYFTVNKFAHEPRIAKLLNRRNGYIRAASIFVYIARPSAAVQVCEYKPLYVAHIGKPRNSSAYGRGQPYQPGKEPPAYPTGMATSVCGLWL